MFNITQENIEGYYSKIKRCAQKHYEKGDFEKSIVCIDYAAIMMYYVNLIYRDEQLEQLMNNISKKILPNILNHYSPIKDRFVFYDQIGNHTVLTLQYLRALMSWNVEFLYIIEPSRYSQPDKIIAELENYSKATVLILNGMSRIEQIKNAYNAIVEYRAEKAFLHFGAEGATGITLWNGLSQIVRYRIVPGDHHFYLGVNISDYAIEFREFGIAVALEKRGFQPSQILKQAYYPIEIVSKFQGFPVSIPSDCVVMFSGGAFYKTYGENDVFFEILKTLLIRNPKLIILFAGSGDDKKFVDFVIEHKFENRLILLGFRKDLSALMENIDIYLGTYPFVGGLMSQYAALKSKPIVQYNTPDKTINMLNGILNYGKEDEQIDIFDLEKFYDYAKRLIDDNVFRKSEGEKLHKLIITPKQFNVELHKLIINKNFQTTILPTIDYTLLSERSIDLLNKYTFDLELLYLNMLRRGVVFLFPKLLFRKYFIVNIFNNFGKIFKKV